MKLIFLDVDGVLNSHRNILAFGGWPWPNIEEGSNAEKNLDPIAIGMLRAICEKTEAKIVLSSTWRLHVEPIAWGNKWDLPIVAGTSGNLGKPAAIRDYLDMTQRNVKCVTHYAIIDDDDMQDKEHQVWTGEKDGFLFDHASQVLKLLGAST